jgi:2'-5' RNA ligase
MLEEEGNESRGPGPGAQLSDGPGQVLSGHWSWRPEWTAEHRMWWWYATFENVPAVRRLAAETRNALKPDAPVDVVPTQWLHLTLAELGGSAGVPRPLAYEAARRAVGPLAELPPVDIQVGPLRTLPGAVVLGVHGSGLRQVHDRLVAALPDELPEHPVQRPFDPHVSIAYLARDCRASDLLRCDARTGALLRLSVKAKLDHVTLVEVVRDRGHYWWTPRCRVPLDGHPTTALASVPATQRARHLRPVDD